MRGTPTVIPGKIDNAFSFDGVDDAIAFPRLVGGQPLDLTGKQWTLAAWVYWDGTLYNRDIVMFNDGQGNRNGLGNMNDANRGRFRFMIDRGSTAGALTASAVGYAQADGGFGPNPSPNRWYHIVGVWDGSVATIYVDGALAGSSVSASTDYNFAGDDFSIGSSRGTSAYWGGDIDEVRIYTRALSASEINDLYNFSGVVVTSPPVRSNLSPAGILPSGTGRAILSVVTDEAATCKCGISPDVPYELLPETLHSTDGLTHSREVQVYDDNAYTYYVRCIDTAGNANADDAQITFSVASVAATIQLEDRLFAAGFEAPSTFSFAPDGRVFVGEKGGKVKVVKNGAVLAEPFIDLPAEVIDSEAGESFDAASEKGLLGIAFHPEFATNPERNYVYVYYTLHKPGNPTPSVNRVARFSAAGDRADSSTGQFIILDDIPAIAGNHNGGWLGFGPDGKLYISVGDGGGWENRFNAQSISSLNGKILRLNDDGTIPLDNPTVEELQYVDPVLNPEGTTMRPEIWAMGFRNPWRCRFRPDGKLFCADVGQDSWEEVDIVEKGKNYGWPFREANSCFAEPCPAPLEGPIFAYPRSDGASIIGGDFGLRTAFPGDYQSSYIFADYIGGWIKRVVLDVTGNAVVGAAKMMKPFTTGESAYITDLKIGPDGSVYFNNIAFGTIRRLGLRGPNTAPVAAASATTPLQGTVPMTVNFSSAGSSDPENDPLSYFWNFGDGTTSLEAFPVHTYSAPGQYIVTLTVSENHPNGLSSSASLTVRAAGLPQISSMTPSDGATFLPGDTITLNAVSTDALDGILPSGAYSWNVILHHNSDNPHSHPYLTATGNSQTFVTLTGEPDIQTYSYEIVLTARNSFGLAATRTVFIYPRPPNAPPTITQISDQTIFQGSTTPALSFTIADAETAAESLILTGQSSNPDLVPNDRIVFGGTADARTVSVAPLPGKTGATVITVIVSDGQVSSSISFLLTVKNSPPPANVGLVAYWNLDDLLGSSVPDNSGNNQNGALKGTPTVVPGKIDNAFSFDGSDDAVTFPRVSGGQPLDLTGKSWTAAAWVYWDGTAYGREIVMFNDGQGNRNGLGNMNDSNRGRIRFVIDRGSTSGSLTAAATLYSQPSGGTGPYPAANRWYHVAGVWDGTTARIYVDGVLAGSSTSASTDYNFSGDDFSIGSSRGTSSFWGGDIDEVRVYERALNDAEITQLYNFTGAAAAAPPVLSGFAPVGTLPSGTATTTISLFTDEVANCKCGTSPEVSYDLLPITLETVNGLTHSASVRVYDDNSYTYYVRCIDAEGNVNTEDAQITFTVASAANEIQFEERLFAAGFDTPSTFAFAPDGRVFVGEKGGVVKIIKNGVVHADPFIDIPAQAIDIEAGERFEDGFEKGLLGIAFHPDFATDANRKYVYIFYSLHKPGAPTPAVNRIARYTAAGDQADVSAGETIILDDIPAIAGNHNGGWLGFGPDGKLYVAVGDGGGTDSRWNAQRLFSLNGKILRLNDDGTIPSDNPTLAEFQYVDPELNPSGTTLRPEIWALGFRNPWRCRFSPDGRLFCADVGQDNWEEVDIIEKGKNYGWPFREANRCSDEPCPLPLQEPVYAYPRSEGASIIGGDFGIRTGLPGDYASSYIFADYVEGWIKRIVLDVTGAAVVGSAKIVRPAATGPSGYITDLQVGPDGNIYFNNIAFGTLRRLSVKGPNTAPVAVASATSPLEGPVPLTVNFSSSGTFDANGDSLSYLWNFGDGTTSTDANPTHTYSAGGQYIATLTVTDNHTEPLSTSASLTVRAGSAPTISILAPADGSTFISGETISLQAASTDAIDGPLPPNAHSWSVLLHHNNDNPHTHPYVTALAGNPQSFVAAIDEPDLDKHFFEIILTVQNSFGLPTTRSVFIYPRPSNTSPTVSVIADQTITQDSTTSALSFSISDAESAADTLIVTGQSSNPALVTDDRITFSGSDGARTVTISPLPNATGTTTITIIVSDGILTTSRSFLLTVQAITPPPTAGLAAHWSFDSLMGANLIPDDSGNANHGTIKGNPSFVAGPVANALSFDGVDDAITFPRIVAGQALDLTGKSWSVSAWVYWDGVSYNRDIVLFSDGQGNRNGLGNMNDSNRGRFRFQVDRGSVSGAVTVSCPHNPIANRWYHLSATWDGSTARIYVDGALCASAAGSTDYSFAGDDFSIGSSRGSGGYWQGDIDEVRIYQRALSAEDIAALYQNP